MIIFLKKKFLQFDIIKGFSMITEKLKVQGKRRREKEKKNFFPLAFQN